MLEYPLLYRKKGKRTDVWQIVVEKTSKGVFKISSHGVLDGKMTSNKRQVSKLGRQKSLWDQACYESKKKWDDKKKKEGYVENLAEASLFVSPMLASKMKILKGGKVSKIPFPFYVQPKIDGFRCMVHWDDNTDEIVLKSRKNIVYKGFPTLRDQLIDFFSELPETEPGLFGSGRFYLDGELYVPGLFEDCSHHLQTGRHHENYDVHNLCFNIFDCFDLDSMDTPFEERTAFLREMLEEHQDTQLHFLETTMVNSLEEMKDHFTRFMAEGHEGLIARHPDVPYELQKRSAYLLKYKEFDDDEFEIIGFEEAKGNDRGSVIWKCKMPNGKEFNVRPRGSRELRKEWFQNAESYIGRKDYTVIYFGLTEDGIPRFPVGKSFKNGN
jgi:DNA ligase-1